VGSDRRALRQNRAQEFGRLHPRLTVIMTSVVLAGLIAICAFQIRHGTYLGAGWLVAAVAGMAAAAALGPAALISNLRHRPTVDGLGIGWTVLTAGSAWSLTFPFPVGRYGSVQAFFNMVHAILLGYAAVSYAALIALFAFLIIHTGSLPSRAELRQQLPRRQKTVVHGWPGWVLAGAVAGLIAGISLAVAGGSDTNDAASIAAGTVILVALAAVSVGVLATLYRLYRRNRRRRLAALPPGLRGNAPGDWRSQDPAG
jgi:hypothetical protein